MIIHPLIKAKKYIPLDEIYIAEGSRVLIDADTGMGKTTLAMTIPQTEKYRIILFPTIVIGKNKRAGAGEGGLEFYYDGKVPDCRYTKEWMATFDNILKIPSHVLNEAVVYIDEVHLIASSQYRTSMPEIVAYIFKHAKTVVGLSGTIKPNVLDRIFEECYTVRKDCPQHVQITNVLCVRGTDKSKFALIETFGWLKKGYSVMLIMQDKANLKEYAKNIRVRYFNEEHYSPEDEPEGSAVIKYVSEESKRTAYNSEDAHRMIETGSINDNVRVICGTSVLAQGWDLHHNGEWVVVVAGDTHTTDNLKMPDTLKQIAARFRNVTSINIRVQRNERNEKPVNTLFNEKKIVDIVNWKRKQRLEELKILDHSTYTKLHRFTLIEEQEGKLVRSFTEVPLLEALENGMNRAHKYGTKEYEKLAHELGIKGIYACEFDYEKAGNFGTKLTIREASNALIESGFIPCDQRIEKYLKTGNDELIDEVTKEFIFTAKRLGINARPRLDVLRWLLEVYDTTSLIYAVMAVNDKGEPIVSIDQLENYAKIKLDSIKTYEVRDLLLKNFEGKEVTLKQIRKTMDGWSDKHFLGYDHKRQHLQAKTAETLIGRYVNYTSVKKQKNGIREQFFIISSNEDLFLRDDCILKFNWLWIGEQMSLAIESRMTKYTGAHPTHLTLFQKWKSVGVQSLFDDLDAIAS